MASTKANVDSWDYIIIGAGSSGCVIANRLSASPDTSVLLLEAGGPDTDPNIHNPTHMVKLFGTDLDWKYFTAEQPYLNRRKIMLNQGKVLGGSSSINAMIYIRGNRRDYDQWNFLGNEGWSYEDVLPYFKRSEDYEGGESRFHGAGGPLSVVNNHDATPAAHAFVRAAMELGYGGPDWDFNAHQQEGGAGIYQHTITRDGKRSSAAVAFLNPILDRPNLELRTGISVSHLLIERDSAVGVEYLQDGRANQVRANREVILSAGVIGSTKILMLSGIGPADHLRAHGIQVIVDLPGVGQNLQDHSSLGIIFKAQKEPPKPAAFAEAGLFVKTRQGVKQASPDLQYHFQAGIPTINNNSFYIDGSKIIFGSVLCNPFSRGQITLQSANPLDPPIINPNYLQCEKDIQTHLHAIELARELASTQAFAEFVDGELAPGASLTKSELRDYIRNTSSTIWHPVGTCKMGHDAGAVVDPQLRVHEVRGLRIADAAVMPKIIAGNTNAACIMIGEKAADMILGLEMPSSKDAMSVDENLQTPTHTQAWSAHTAVRSERFLANELAHSLTRFSLAMTLFGASQLMDTLASYAANQPTSKTQAAFNSVTYATNGQFDDTRRALFLVGDQLQRGMIDMMSGLLTLDASTPRRMMKMTFDMMQQSAQAFRLLIPGYDSRTASQEFKNKLEAPDLFENNDSVPERFR